MPAGEHKLKLAGTRLAKKSDGGIAESLFATVVNYLAHDLLGIFRAVQAHENLANHLLLIFGKELRGLLVCNMPVVIDLRTQGMIEWECNSFALLFVEAFVEGSDKRLRLGLGGNRITRLLDH